ncbi:MAG: polysaccharide deacetylase family protein, partial [Methyloligellaceae bacterium]
MKARVLNLIRQSHLRFAQRDLPSRLAIYFHQLEKAQLPAFTDAVSFFQDRGYRCVDAQSYASREAGMKLLFLSFDDNFKNWHESLDVLAKAGATCTFYVNSGVFRDEACPRDIAGYFDRINYYGDRETLTKPELRDIADCGHAIGCHTHSHPVLSKTSREDWHGEIAVSKQLLKGITGQPIDDFSIPFGMRRHFSDG